MKILHTEIGRFDKLHEVVESINETRGRVIMVESGNIAEAIAKLSRPKGLNEFRVVYYKKSKVGRKSHYILFEVTIDQQDIVPANAICLTCGTTKMNTSDAFCANGHDTWLEIEDPVERWEVAERVFNLTPSEISSAIINYTDLRVCNQ